MLKKTKNPAQTATFTKRTEPFPSKQAVHAAMVKNPNLNQARAIWDDALVMVKRAPDDGIIRDHETLRFSPQPEPGQKRVACYV